MPDQARNPAPAGVPESTGRVEASARPDATCHREVPAALAADDRQRRWSSQQLLGSQTEAEITHAGAVYKLRLTALGKLILTK